jgi:hypothetical protein
MLQVPYCESSTAAGHHARRAGKAAVGGRIPDELAGA